MTVSQRDAEKTASLNERLAEANARAAELVAELEGKTAELSEANARLAEANACSAELVAELQVGREELEWANTNLRQANEEKKRILGVAAHDLRSGVGGIQNLSNLLLEAVSGSEKEVCDQVRLIGSESGRLLALLESLLENAKIESGKMEVKLGKVDLAALITEAVRLHEDQARRKGQTLKIEGLPGALELEADGLRIRQVLDNLLSNGIKYGPQGGTLSVEAWEREGAVGVSVSDEGPGFTEEDFGKVFGEFARLSARPTGGEESHGLGLSIAKKIVEAHGGRIWVENREDRGGARFTFTLPSAEGEVGSLEVLVVDDDPLNRAVAGKLLEGLGHNATTAESGEEAIELLVSSPYDMILMDVEMPGMGGVEATAAIRAREAGGRRTPIIGLTGHRESGKCDECRRAGMDQVLSKPLDPRTLRATLNRLVPSTPRS
jgi:signal transduction histidine kinase/ActR/RegA family two-component response regulator